MLIEETFKEFCKATLSEPMNKSKQNHDICIEAYAKTQLIDLSAIFPNTYGDNNYKAIVGEDTDGNIMLEANLDLNIVLPFDTCFLRLYTDEVESLEKEAHIFIREYRPGIYTGCIMTGMGSYIWKNTFQIYQDLVGCVIQLRLTYDEKHYGKDKEVINHLFQFLMNKISRTLMTLEKLSPKTHDTYITKPCKAVYYTKKTTKQTFKVERPVYIYVDKKPTVKGKATLDTYKSMGVERSSSWFVRGHWRKLDAPNKRGKNAQGEYVIEGFTWVLPHKCGNKDILPENKTYIALGKVV